MPTVIERVEAQDWYKALSRDSQDRLKQILGRNPGAEARADAVLDKLNAEWSALTPAQRRAQVEGAILLEDKLHSDEDSLEGLDWYENLSYAEQDEVRRTIQGNTRIRGATERTAANVSDKEIRDVNPWYRLLNP